MNEYELLAMFRGIERLIIELGAIATIVMGTLLYRWGVKGPQDVEASGSGFTFKLSNAAPGSVLALFGMVILIVGLKSPLERRKTRDDLDNPEPKAHDKNEARPTDEGGSAAVKPDAGNVPADDSDRSSRSGGASGAEAGGGHAHTVRTTDVFTYASLSDELRQEIDSLGRLRAVPADRALEVLRAHKRTAQTLLTHADTLEAAKELLKLVRDADEGDPSASLAALASSAVATKTRLGRAR